MSSIPSNAMPHATDQGDTAAANATPPAKDGGNGGALAAAKARLPKIDVEAARKRLSETGGGVVAQIRAHPASAAAAGALLVGGIALSALPSLRRRGTDGLRRVKAAAQERFAGSDDAPKKGKAKGRGKASAA